MFKAGALGVLLEGYVGALVCPRAPGLGVLDPHHQDDADRHQDQPRHQGHQDAQGWCHLYPGLRSASVRNHQGGARLRLAHCEGVQGDWLAGALCVPRGRFLLHLDSGLRKAEFIRFSTCFSINGL